MSATETDEQVEERIAVEMGPDGEHVEVDPETGEIHEPAAEPDEEEEGADARAARTGDVEKASRSLEKESARHAARVEDVMGPDFAALVPCELCWDLAPGFRWDREPDEATKAAVRIAIGLPDVSNFAPSATERTCDDCRGLGKVRTGSTVPNRETITCDACAGLGYVPTRPRLNGATAPPEQADAPDAPAAFPDDGIARDMFGTPSTDPDYGKMPNMRARPVDYWRSGQA
jgi:hypothetical protein